MDWSLGKMIRTHLKPRSFSSRSRGNRTEDCQEACREFGFIELRFIELCATTNDAGDSNGERQRC